MDKNFTRMLKKAFVLIAISTTLCSCKNTFDFEPEEALEQNQTYQNVYDADAVVLGIYGKFLGLAEQYVLLNELRADLLDVTPNSNAWLKQLNGGQVSEDNPYADPRPFYEVILNCNDALKNFKIMQQSYALTNEEYNQRAADIGMLRTWLYLQLGIHFGTIPYVTDPLDNVSDLNDHAKFPLLSFDKLLDNLIQYVETIPENYLNQNTSSSSPTLIMPMNNYVVLDGVFKFFVHKRSLKADLYLWKGDYMLAAKSYKDVMETATTLTSTTDYKIDMYDTYRISNDNSGRNTLLTTGSINPWRSIFGNVLSDPETNRERMWTLPLDQNYAPKNPFIDLFSTEKSYLVQPSAAAINNWDSQIRIDGGIGDRRGLQSSYINTPKGPQVTKYTMNFSGLDPFKTTGVWILYRAATLHLRYAEAANRLNQSEIAGALINQGIKTIAEGNPTGQPYPFDFDPTEKSSFHGMWYRNIGIRGRAVNQSIAVDSSNIILSLEDKIIDEAGLETAFEGYRWPDLLRITLRREKLNAGAGLAFLNQKLAVKFALSTAGSQRVYSSISDLYLPFKLD